MGDLCPTHATLTLHLNFKAPAYTAHHLRVPKPLEELVQQQFCALFGAPPCKPDNSSLFDEELPFGSYLLVCDLLQSVNYGIDELILLRALCSDLESSLDNVVAI